MVLDCFFLWHPFQKYDVIGRQFGRTSGQFLIYLMIPNSYHFARKVLRSDVSGLTM